MHSVRNVFPDDHNNSVFMNIDNEIKTIKHDFMAFRNGIVADTLRKAGMHYNIIFGLQLPQISEISRKLQKDLRLAETLWNDSGVRESRLLACYLFPVSEIDEDKAFELATSVQTAEEADILSFRLLKYLPFASVLADRLDTGDNTPASYCGKALRRNLESR